MIRSALFLSVLAAFQGSALAGTCMREDGTRISTRSMEMCERFGGVWTSEQIQTPPTRVRPTPPAESYFFSASDRRISDCHAVERKPDYVHARERGEANNANCLGQTDHLGVQLVRCTTRADGAGLLFLYAPDLATCQDMRRNVDRILRP